MATVDISELKAQTEEIVRRVRDERETIELVEAGKFVARLVPAEPDKSALSPEDEAILDDLDQLASDVGQVWPLGVTAEDAVREQRREL